jgi:PAS domain S-box-containing protein
MECREREMGSTDVVCDPTLSEAILEQAPDAVIFADREGLIRLWNQSAAALFGYAAAEVLGRSLDVIIPERLRNAHWQGYRKATETGVMKYAGRVLTTRSVHKDGRRVYVDLSFGVVRDGAGHVIGALAIGRDCTERYLSQRAAAAPAKPSDDGSDKA